MKYRFVKFELTCTNIEAELGLARGDIKGITVFADGTIEVEVVKELTLAQKSTLRSLFQLADKVVQ